MGLELRALVKSDSDCKSLNPLHPEVIACDEIAGGNYWQQIVLHDDNTHEERIENIAAEYSKRLGEWFTYVIRYPIREKYDHPPKYHLIFGSRHEDAIELMNRAMVTARREFVGAQFVKGQLFPNQPQEEVVEDQEIVNSIIRTLQQLDKPITWKRLRVEATISEPCRYTDSEWNRGIKQAILQQKIRTNASGKKIEQDAVLSALT